MKYIVFALVFFISTLSAADIDPANYKNWHKVTIKPYMVIPSILTACVPGVGPGGPHTSKSVHIYLNEIAYKAYKNNSPYPVNSSIVKEKLNMNNQPAGIGAMTKDNNGKWQYYYKDKTITTGRIKSCVKCHKKADDEVFGYWKTN